MRHCRLVVAYPSEYLVRVLQEPIRLHRACHGDDQSAMLEALRSNYERDRRPPHPADLHASVLRMAVSLFERPDGLAHLARQRPERIGTHIVTLRLQPGLGICLADTARRDIGRSGGSRLNFWPA